MPAGTRGEAQVGQLDGKIAWVTGAGSGIGEAAALALAAEGATVILTGRRTAPLEDVARRINQTGKAHVQPADLTVASQVQKVGDYIRQTFNRLDILVNNAGIAGRAAPISEQTDEDWQAAIAINLTGVFNWCRAVVPHMRARQYGRIVNIASIAGKEGNPRMVPYSATKAGVIALTKSLGKELATEGICVNAVSPAVVHTPILDQLTPQQIAYMTERIPMGRTGKPEEIAAVVHFLASPDCSFVTAQCYDVSGGRATY